MKNILMILLAVFICSGKMIASDFPAYKLYNDTGEEITFQDMAEQSSQSGVVFFGELHNNTISHWLQYELTTKLYETKKEELILGAEMFESDNQLIIDEYFDGHISTKSFEKECRLWNNYKTDYRPVFEFARKNGLKYIATNIPRRYASLVSKQGYKGLDSLSREAKQYIAPLPINVDLKLNCYKQMDQMGMAHNIEKKDSSSDGKTMPAAPLVKPVGEMKEMSQMVSFVTKFKQAQAVKDATMAHFIMKNLKEGSTFLHFNGAYHSNNHEAIPWIIKRDKPEVKILTITTIEKDSFEPLTEEEKKMADIIIVVKSSVTKTY